MTRWSYTLFQLPVLTSRKTQVQGVLLVGDLYRLVPVSLVLLAKGRMPDENAVGMRHERIF